MRSDFVCTPQAFHQFHKPARWCRICAHFSRDICHPAVRHTLRGVILEEYIVKHYCCPVPVVHSTRDNLTHLGSGRHGLDSLTNEA